jgi:hypothetical protein
MPASKSTCIALALLVGIMAQGSGFRVRVLVEMGFKRSTVYRVLLTLKEEGVIQKANTRKWGIRYMLSDDFKERMKAIVGWKGPVLPGHALLDICWIENWTEESINAYLNDVRGYWQLRRSLKQSRYR